MAQQNDNNHGYHQARNDCHKLVHAMILILLVILLPYMVVYYVRRVSLKIQLLVLSFVIPIIYRLLVHFFKTGEEVKLQEELACALFIFLYTWSFNTAFGCVFDYNADGDRPAKDVVASGKFFFRSLV